MDAPRPILHLERSTIERVADVLTVLGILVCVAGVVATFAWVEGPIPKHMNAAGKPDAWGGRGTLVFVAALASVMAAGLARLRRVPHTFNYGTVVVTTENAPRLYRLGRELVALMGTAVAWTFALNEVAFVLVALRVGVSTAPWLLPVSLAVTFVPLGVYLVRIQRAA